MPKVSTVIPTYNRSAFLGSAIESALNQRFEDFEIIVADDSSMDNNKEVVRSFKDKRIRYIRHEKNMGVSAARNTAIRASKGEYIAFLDDDDEWLPDKLHKQVELMDRSPENVCGIYSNRLVIDKLSNRIISANPRAEKLSGNLLYQLAIGNPIHTSTVLVRKGCLEKVGLFDETISYMEDRDLWIRLSIEWDFEYVDEVLVYKYSHQEDSLCENIKSITEGRETMLERYDYLFKQNRKICGKLYLSQGVCYCRLNNMKKGREKIVRAILLYPYNINCYTHFFCSLLGSHIYGRIRKLAPFKH
ncbi:MAG: glycosyltransferase [Deltaproteobacteria bacterium]|jgi:glycosyltransferase involved in cell wall biosynthesis|nr:glycosyltransferase [Deltaproteobacteria bacterium]